MTLTVGATPGGCSWCGPGPAAKVNGGGLSGPAARLTGVEVAIGTEAVAFVTLIAGSGGLTAAWLFEVVRGCPRVQRGVACAASRWRGMERQRETGEKRETEKPDERSRMIGKPCNVDSSPVVLESGPRVQYFVNIAIYYNTYVFVTKK